MSKVEGHRWCVVNSDLILNLIPENTVWGITVLL